MSTFKSEMRRRILEGEDTPEYPAAIPPVFLGNNDDISTARMDISLNETISEIEAIDIDDIGCLMECGKSYTVKDLVEEFGISVDSAKSVLALREHVNIAQAIAEMEINEATDISLNHGGVDEAEPFGNYENPQNSFNGFHEDKLAQMVESLEHLFD